MAVRLPAGVLPAGPFLCAKQRREDATPLGNATKLMTVKVASGKPA
jgi:hypothetical protein